jgi:hypothetical protein
MKPQTCARKAEVPMDEPIDFAAVDELLAMTREAVRHATEVVRESREVQEQSRALRWELRRELRRGDLLRERRPATSPTPRPRIR